MSASGGEEAGEKTANLGSGCLMLFGAPFLLAGLLSIAAAWRQWSSPNPQEKWWAVLLVGLTFAGAGGGVIGAGWSRRRKLLERAALQRQYPGKPWMWRRDWAAGRIESETWAKVLVVWVVAAFANVGGWTAVLAAREQLAAGGPAWWAVALVPVAGLALLGWAVTETLRQRKYGVSVFELATLPGVVGGRLAGRIETRMAEVPGEGVRLNLDCIRVERSGKSSTERQLWQTEAEAPASRLSRGWQGVSIPVEFQIPYDVQPTSAGSDMVLWRLTVHAATSGVDFQARFEPPIFRTAQSRPEEDLDEEEATAASPRVNRLESATSAAPQGARFVERPMPGGGVELYCPPPLNTMGATGAAVLLAAWLTALAVMLDFGLSWFITVPFGLLGVLTVVAVLVAAFVRSTIRIEGDQLSAARTVFGFGKATSLRAQEIAQVKVAVAWTQGQTLNQTSRSFWDVVVIRKTGKDLAVARNLPKRAEADWIATEIRRRLGIPEPKRKRS